MPNDITELSWKDSIYRQREELARMLREPLDQLAGQVIDAWGDREQLNTLLIDGFSSIPYCSHLYVMDKDARQISDNIGVQGIVDGHYQRDRSGRPYMQEPIPEWGFLLSDAYIGLMTDQPSLSALQVVKNGSGMLGYLGADFDLRRLPVTASLYEEPEHWRQVKGDPAIRSMLFHQTRVESPMDRNVSQAFSILEELLTQRGIFHTQIHFSSSQAIIWVIDDPLRYRILDHEVLTDPDICLVYPSRNYPTDAIIPAAEIPRLLEALKELRTIDTNIYLRTASINIFNGLVSLTFSCDGSHYMRYDEFLAKGSAFWAGLPE